jgi:hypothetical protein
MKGFGTFVCTRFLGAGAVALFESRFDVFADVTDQVGAVHESDPTRTTFPAQRERANRWFEAVLLAGQHQAVQETPRQPGDRTLLTRWWQTEEFTVRRGAGLGGGLFDGLRGEVFPVTQGVPDEVVHETIHARIVAPW